MENPSIPYSTPFLILWLAINLLISRHILQGDKKLSLRLTSLSHYSVTVLNASYLVSRQTQNDGVARLSVSLHKHLAILMFKVTILFTGLIFLFAAFDRDKVKTPVTNGRKHPFTVTRVLRNLYTHYVSTAILLCWPSVYVAEVTPIDVLSNNVVLMGWLAVVLHRFNYIYEIEGISTREIVTPLVFLSILSDFFSLRVFS